MARIRHAVATLTVGSESDAESLDWHPVLDTYARGVTLMRALDPGVTRTRGSGRRTRTASRPAPGPAGLGPVRARLAVLPAVAPRLPGLVREHHPHPHRRVGLGPAVLGLLRTRATRPGGPCPRSSRCATRTVGGAVVANPLLDPNRATRPAHRTRTSTSSPRWPRPGSSARCRRSGSAGRTVTGVFGDVEMHAAQLRARRDRRRWAANGSPHGPPGTRSSGCTTPTSTGSGRSGGRWRARSRLTDPDRRPRCWSRSGSRRSSCSAANGTRTFTMDDVEDLASASWTTTTSRSSCRPRSPMPSAAAREAAGGGSGLGRTAEPRWEPVAATFDLDSGEEREVEFTAGPRGLDEAPRRPAGPGTGRACGRPTRTRPTSWRCAPRRTPRRTRGTVLHLRPGRHPGGRRAQLPGRRLRGAARLEAEGWSGGALSVRLVPEPGRADSGDAGPGDPRPAGHRLRRARRDRPVARRRAPARPGPGHPAHGAARPWPGVSVLLGRRRRPGRPPRDPAGARAHPVDPGGPGR